MNLLKKLFQRPAIKREIDEELGFHIEQRTAENIAAGMSPEEAAREARKRFGNVQSVREECREKRGASFGEDTFRDFRFAFRQLLKNPGFTAVAVLTLALGIGANTAIFSVVNGVILKPLPFDDPDRLVKVLETNPKREVTFFPASVPDYLDWKDRSQSWQSLAAVTSRSVNLSGVDQPEYLQADYVTANYLSLFGLRPALGRMFLPEEDRPGENDVVILTSSLWHRRFGADPAIIGKSAVLNDRKHTIVGVLPADSGLDSAAECYVPLGADPAHEERGNHEIAVYGRLKEGRTIEQAESEMKAIAARIEQEHPDSDQGWSVRLAPLARAVVADTTRQALFILWSVVGLLMLITCANISNLLIVRASTRTREMAVRAALGCGRFRIVRQLLAESLLLSVLGAAVGLLVAFWGVEVLRHFSPDQLPRVGEISIDRHVLLYVWIVTLLTGIVAGLAPVFLAFGVDLQRALKESGASLQSGRHVLRSSLVVIQLALSLVLLTGAGLFLRSFQRLQNVDLGFNPAEVMTLNLAPVENQPVFYKDLVARVEALPGVKSAGLVNGAPLSTFNTSLNVFPVEPALIPPDKSIQSDWRLVTRGYFEALQLPLIKGRLFIPSDGGDGSKVVIINQTLARTLWGEEDPVGKRVNPGGGTSYSTVVGVVGDIRTHNPRQSPAAMFYWPARSWYWGWMTLVVRTTGDPQASVPSLRATIKAIDPNLPVFRVATMEELVRDSLTGSRVQTLLLGGFAAIALLLAALGVYGVMACSVAQRTREIGLRMALGAQVNDVVGMLMKQGGRMILASVIIGLVLGMGFARLLASQLFGIEALDPWSFGLAAIILGLAALTACWLPARRASKVDPIVALRHE